MKPESKTAKTDPVKPLQLTRHESILIYAQLSSVHERIELAIEQGIPGADDPERTEQYLSVMDGIFSKFEQFIHSFPDAGGLVVAPSLVFSSDSTEPSRCAVVAPPPSQNGSAHKAG